MATRRSQGALIKLGRRYSKVEVVNQPHQALVEEDLVAVFCEVGLEPGAVVIEVLVDALEIAVLGDEPGCGLLADAGDTGEVVGRVAPERGVVEVLVGSDPVSVFYVPGIGQDRVGYAAAGVEHLEMVAD